MDFSLSLNPDTSLPIAGLIVLLFLASLPWICHHTDFLLVLRQHLRRFALLYLVAGPSTITYFAVCGAASASAATLFSLSVKGPSQEYANQHGLYTIFHCIEYACSFVGALFFAWLIRWLGLPRLWTILLFVSMSVCAAYRTARVGTGPYLGTGPAILLSPQWLDAIPVILGLCLFLLLSRQHNGRNEQSLPSSTSRGHKLIARLWVTGIVAVVLPMEFAWFGTVVSGNGTGQSSLVTQLLFPVLFTIGIISHFYIRFHNKYRN